VSRKSLDRGTLITEQHVIPRRGSRRVRIYLPLGHRPERETPLLVMLDGQNVFEDAGSFAGGWYAHRAVNRLGKPRPRPIVVAIDHAGTERIDEMSPWKRSGVPSHGHAFLGWIATRLLPDVRRHHRVIAGPAGVLIAGASLGGLAAVYGHFAFPDVFGGALAMSPSFWLAGGKILDFVAAQPKPWTSQIYIDGGAREGDQMAVLLMRMAELLRGRGYPESHVRFRVDRRGTHSERAWRRRLPAALRFFYR